MRSKKNPSLSTKASNRKDLGLFTLQSQIFANKPMFKRPKLYEYKEPEKRWRVTFYVTSKKNGKLVRQEKICPSDKVTAAQKRKWAKDLIEEINEHLDAGHYYLDDIPKVVEEPVVLVDRTFKKAIEETIEFKQRQTQNKETKSTYNFYQKNLIEWAEENNFLDRKIEDFGVDQVFSLIKKMDVNIGPKTYNNYLAFFKSIFNTLIDQEIIKKNPFKALKKKKEVEPPNVPYNEAQKLKILTALSKIEDPTQLYYVKFMYYTLMRPVEVTRIKVFHIHEEKILVPGANSKTKNSEYVIITPGLKTLLRQLRIDLLPRNAYLFGRDGIGTHTQMANNYISRIHTPLLRALGFEEIFTLYSWKDTGACDLYNATKDIIFVSRQCRHKKIDMTMTYLRSMGLLNDMLNASKAPVLPI